MENNRNGEIPEDANEHCPGPQSEAAGKSDECQGCPNQEVCATAPKGPDLDLLPIAERMATVKQNTGTVGERRGWQEHFLRSTLICISSHGSSSRFARH